MILRSKHDNNNNNNNNKTFLLHRKMPKQITSAKRMTSILWYVSEAFPPARQGTILNSHRVIGIATNTSMVLNCALVAGCSVTSYPGLGGSLPQQFNFFTVYGCARGGVQKEFKFSCPCFYNPLSPLIL